MTKEQQKAIRSAFISLKKFLPIKNSIKEYDWKFYDESINNLTKQYPFLLQEYKK
jgi:hypothetical protein